jgi:hypothetical protein
VITRLECCTGTGDSSGVAWLKVRIKGKFCLALLYSGADGSFIDTNIAMLKNNGVQVVQTAEPGMLEGHAATEGNIVVKFLWSEGCSKQEVSSRGGKNRPQVLGCDFLRATKINLCVSAGGCTVGNKDQCFIPFAKTEPVFQCNTVCNTEDEWLTGH